MTPKQAALPFPTAEWFETATLTQLVRYFLGAGDWWMPHELCRVIRAETGVMVSDASITARLRDLRKAKYGAHVIEKRIREGSRAFEYRMAS